MPPRSPLQMQAQPIVSDTPFPSPAIFSPSALTYAEIQGGTTDAGAAYIYRIEANGSASYLNKVVAPDKAATDQFGYSVSQSGNILAVGAYLADPDGISTAGAAYMYRIEANGSATYLNKVVAPDKAASDQFGSPFPSPAIFSP